MLRSVFVVSLAMMIVLSGCRASTGPRTVTRVTPEYEARVRKAPYRGEYQLYAADYDEGGWVKPRGEPLATYRLNPGQPVGFRPTSEGLRAVVGKETVPLERGEYLWQMRADAGQIDRTKTRVFLIIAIGVPIVAYIGAAIPWGPW
jgi:hypothetical protein